MAALDAHERRDLALFVRSANFRGGGRQGKVFRVRAHLLANGVYLCKCPINRVRACDFAGNPNGKENCAQTACAHARNIDAAVGMARADVEFCVKEALGRVVVGIHNDG